MLSREAAQAKGVRETMNTSRVLIPLFILILLIGCSGKEENPPSPEYRLMEDSARVSVKPDEPTSTRTEYSKYYGSWYEKTFLESTLKQRSIKRAYSRSRNLVLKIFKQSNGKEYTNYGSFHDVGGAEVFPISKTEFGLYEFNSSHQTSDRFIMPQDDGGSIVWNSDVYVRTPSLGTMLNFAIIDGIYQDEFGQKYTFDQGHAKWPSKEFDYYLRLDLYGVNTDVLFEEDKSRREFPELATGFERNRDTLKLYKYEWSGDGDLLDLIQPPLATLLEISDDKYFESLRFYNLEHRSKAVLRLLRNEILARHGQEFKSIDLQIYFLSTNWYEKVEGKNVAESELNESEANLLKTITAYEKMAL